MVQWLCAHQVDSICRCSHCCRCLFRRVSDIRAFLWSRRHLLIVRQLTYHGCTAGMCVDCWSLTLQTRCRLGHYRLGRVLIDLRYLLTGVELLKGGLVLESADLAVLGGLRCWDHDHATLSTATAWRQLWIAGLMHIINCKSLWCAQGLRCIHVHCCIAACIRKILFIVTRFCRRANLWTRLCTSKVLNVLVHGERSLICPDAVSVHGHVDLSLSLWLIVRSEGGLASFGFLFCLACATSLRCRGLCLH